MPRREPGQTWTCSCGAKLIGAAHAETRKVGPITAKGDDNGNVLLYRDREGVVTYRPVMVPEVLEWLRSSRCVLRLNHFADCPNVEQYR